MWGPIIAAGISSIGSLAGGALSSAGSAAQNSANNQSAWQMAQFNAHEAELNRNWQMHMSSTAYQRAMEDMRKAGLNPILAYQQGGAGSGSGAQASGVAPRFENAMEGIGQGVTSAAQGAARALELQQVQAQTSNQMTQAELNRASADLAKANTLRANQETITSGAQAQKNSAETALITEQMQNPAAVRELLRQQAIHSAAQGRTEAVRATDTEKYGSGFLSREIGGPIERMWDRVSTFVKKKAAENKPDSETPRGRARERQFEIQPPRSRP